MYIRCLANMLLFRQKDIHSNEILQERWCLNTAMEFWWQSQPGRTFWTEMGYLMLLCSNIHVVQELHNSATAYVCDNVLSPHLKATSCCLAYQIRIDMLDTCLTEKQLCRLQQVLRLLSLLLEQGLLHSGPSSLNPGVKEQNAEP